MKMKKTVLVLVLLMLCTLAFTQNDSVSLYRVQTMLEDDLFANQGVISLEAQNLSSTDKMIMYNMFEQKAGVPFLLNTFLGLGIGSYVQGDTTFGVISTITDIVCAVGFTANFFDAVNLESQAITYSRSGTMTSSQQKAYEDAIAKAAGWLVVRGIWGIAEMVRPFIYRNDYNKTLKTALRIGVDEPKVSFAPVIGTSGAIGLSMGVSF